MIEANMFKQSILAFNLLFCTVLYLGCGDDEDKVERDIATYCNAIVRLPEICQDISVGANSAEECEYQVHDGLDDLNWQYPKCLHYMEDTITCLADAVSSIQRPSQCNRINRCGDVEDKLNDCMTNYVNIPDDFPDAGHPSGGGNGPGNNPNPPSDSGNATIEDLIQQSIEHCIANGHMMTICMSEFYEAVDESYCSRSFYNEVSVNETAGGTKCYASYSKYLQCLTRQTQTLTTKEACNGPNGYPGYEKPCRELSTAWYNCKEGTNY